MTDNTMNREMNSAVLMNVLVQIAIFFMIMAVVFIATAAQPMPIIFFSVTSIALIVAAVIIDKREEALLDRQ